MKPLVNVVIPVYNKSATVTETISSIKSQTLNNFTCYIVDDCSTDNSAEVVQSTIKGDARFSYHKNERNLRVAETRNHGASLGDAPYLCFVDSDDQIAPEFLSICYDEIIKDRSLGVVYTGITIIHPDGRRELSQWPDQFDFNKQMRGQNQIPTCSLWRREAWERLGGQRTRYTDPVYGCGAEDAEAYLRLGAYGWNARKVTDAGLFWYRLGGSASSKPDSIAWNFKAWSTDTHPWCDGKATMPYASIATPKDKRPSWPVHQFDEPKISIVIPVGPNHTDIVVDAFDSVESQTMDHWEIIAVLDGKHDPDKVKRLQKAYPFVRYLFTGDTPKGAGYARNRGAEIARAPLLTFCDSDDILYPQFLEKCFLKYLDTRDCVYTAYVTKAYIKDLNDSTLARDIPPRVKWRDDRTGETIIGWKPGQFDCARAIMQPEQGRDPYIWCNINVLFPTEWHFGIGGFDESVPAWEDLFYWWDMARAGHCFSLVPEELMMYRVYTGSRRQLACPEGDAGRQIAKSLLQYIRQKYDSGEKPVPCSGCGRRAPVPSRTVAQTNLRTDMKVNQMSDDDYVMVKLNSGNIGEMSIVGPTTKNKYGMRVHGETFLMHVADQQAMPDRYPIFLLDLPQKPKEEVRAPEPIKVEVKVEPLPEPEPIKVEVAEEVEEEEIAPATISYEEFKAQILSDPEVKAVYDELVKEDTRLEIEEIRSVKDNPLPRIKRPYSRK